MLTSSLVSAEFSVSPVRLYVAAGDRHGNIIARNLSDQRLRLAFSARRWLQDDSGRDQFHEDEQLMIFPQEVSIAAGDAQVIRVGLSELVTDQERAFQLVITEVPTDQESHRRAAEEHKEKILSVAVPVFFQVSDKHAADMQIESVQVVDARVSFLLANPRQRHLHFKTYTIALLSPEGAVVDQTTGDGWYVHAGGRKAFDVPLAAPHCRRAAFLQATILLDDDQSVSEQITVEPSDC